MKPINKREIRSLATAQQHFQDCYLVASLNVLSRCEEGRKILQNNIRTDGNAYTVRFNNVAGKSETYLVRREECDNLVLCDRFLNVKQIKEPHNPIVKVVEVAMSKLLKVHPEKKPLVSRMMRCNENFEFNKPSNFLYMFTGVKPVVINESGLSMSLRKHKNAVNNIFQAISEDKNSCFLVGTGAHSTYDLANYHCYPIIGVNSLNISSGELHHSVRLYEGRTKSVILEPPHSVIKNLKYICGYFGDMLK